MSRWAPYFFLLLLLPPPVDDCLLAELPTFEELAFDLATELETVDFCGF